MSEENDAWKQHAKDNAFSIEDVAEHPEIREAIKQADLFYGYNLDQDKLFLFHGHETLKLIAANRLGKGVECKIAAIKYREHTGDELEYAVAVSLALKGSCAIYEGREMRIIERDDDFKDPFDPSKN